MFLEDFKKSLQLTLYERISSPLSGALIFSWLVWNWKILYSLLFYNSTTSLQARIKYIEINYINYENNIYHPILTALFILLIYPFATTGALYVWLLFKKWQNAIKNKVEDNQLLTLEQSIEIRLQIRQQQEEISKLVMNKDIEITALKKQISDFDNMKKGSKLVRRGTTTSQLLEISDKAKQLLVAAANDPNGKINTIIANKRTYYHTNGIDFGNDDKPRSKVEWEAAYNELNNNSLIKSDSIFEYSVTKKGYELVDQLRSTV